MLVVHQGSNKYDEEFISTSPPHSINTIGQMKSKVTTSDDTMTMLLILCIIVWILFQLKKVNIYLFVLFYVCTCAVPSYLHVNIETEEKY